MLALININDDENENPTVKNQCRTTDACRRTVRRSADNCSDHFNRIPTTRPQLTTLGSPVSYVPDSWVLNVTLAKHNKQERKL